jgi:hypothetical protein
MILKVLNKNSPSPDGLFHWRSLIKNVYRRIISNSILSFPENRRGGSIISQLILQRWYYHDIKTRESTKWKLVEQHPS